MKKKTVHLGFRLTEDEHNRMKALMSMMGYRSVSLFIREQILRSRVVRRNLSKTEANLSRQIEQVHLDIKRIGVNYNQVVRALNTLSKLRDKRGNVVITNNTINGKLMDLKILMETLLDRVLILEHEVELLKEDDDEETSEASDDMYNQ